METWISLHSHDMYKAKGENLERQDEKTFSENHWTPVR